MPHLCVRGHNIHGPRDMLPDNGCRQCDRENQARYQDRRKLAMSLLRRMEEAGLKQAELRETDGFAIGLRWASSADDDELVALERQHPAIIGKLRNQLARIDAGNDAFVTH